MRLSLILPTYNEAENIEALCKALASIVREGDEVFVVDDDSPDRTWEKAEELRGTYPWLRVLRRIGRRGLSSAVMEGFEAATGDVLAVMDADLQHDPHVLRALADGIEAGATVAVASRYRAGGSTGPWAANRKLLSRAGTGLASLLLPVHTTDPMSGFFAVRAEAFRPVAGRMHPRGFKILLELLSVLPQTSTVFEAPLHFQPRVHGMSKMSGKVLFAFGFQLLLLFLRRMHAWLWPIFLAIVALLGLLWAPRAWSLRLLVDPAVRGQVERSLEAVSSAEGWLMSDVALQSVNAEGLTLLRRVHGRGPDAQTCFTVAFENPVAVPCAD